MDLQHSQKVNRRNNVAIARSGKTFRCIFVRPITKGGKF